MKVWTKFILGTLAACLGLMILTGCQSTEKADNEIKTENPSGVTAADLTLSNDEMVAALTELARRTERQMLAADPHAKVEFRVAEDGSCGFYAAGTEDDGTVAEEMEEISTGESVKAFFDSYYNAGFFDEAGNVLGFPEDPEVPVQEMPAESGSTEESEMIESDSIRETVTPEGGSGEIAGFPEDGTIMVEDQPESANEG